MKISLRLGQQITGTMPFQQYITGILLLLNVILCLAMQKFPRATYPFKYHPTIAKCFLYTLSVPNTFACFPYCPVLESVKALWSLRYKLPKKKKRNRSKSEERSSRGSQGDTYGTLFSQEGTLCSQVLSLTPFLSLLVHTRNLHSKSKCYHCSKNELIKSSFPVVSLTGMFCSSLKI